MLNRIDIGTIRACNICPSRFSPFPHAAIENKKPIQRFLPVTTNTPFLSPPTQLKFQLDCPLSLREHCSMVEFSNRTRALYSGCVSNLRNSEAAKRARSTWIWIASCIGAFVGCVLVALCCVHRRSRDRRQRLKEQEVLATSNANTEQLLNKDAHHEQLLNKDGHLEQA